MREILFRGKRADDGAWVYGWPCRYPFGMWPLKDAIIPSEDAEGGYHRFVEVDPSTVGQYTGLTDKNGRRIFEGDLLVLATSRTHEVKFADGSFYMEGTTFPSVMEESLLLSATSTTTRSCWRRLMAVRKIDLMHQMFGTADGKCGACDHLIEGRYHDRMLRKCEVYGMTHSEASDWAKRWKACGLFNKETNHKNVIRLVGAERGQPAEPIEGQIGLEMTNNG